MNKLKYLFRDLIKCLKYALLATIILSSLTFIFFVIINKSINLWLLSDIIRHLYYLGCLILFLSVCFFFQNNTLRPLPHKKEWKEKFRVLPLHFVIMFMGLFICSMGMLLQFVFESLLA